MMEDVDSASETKGKFLDRLSHVLSIDPAPSATSKSYGRLFWGYRI